jgi:hypothetical protein
MTTIREAFFAVCDKAEPASEASYVSLYVTVPYYGGPEEGGWWGSDEKLIASRKCASEVEAQSISKQVQELADELSKEAKNNFGRQCQYECEWLEARGLDADYLPEVDGEETYWVTIESTPGKFESEGSRHYE